jgi:DNA-binding transcriptional MerR regulator
VHQSGDAAALVGLSLRTIRHYEEVGLVPPSGRSAGGFRLYTDGDVERLRFVKDMKPLDFTLEEMRDILEIRDALAGDPTSARTALLREGLARYSARADQRCTRLREQLAQAEELADLLRAESAP